jgi:SHS2 domain-containing protein
VSDCGYREFEHTADWGIYVWAADLITLLTQAAKGMFALLEIKAQPGDLISLPITITGVNLPENLIVDFLNELLYLSERDNLGFEEYRLDFEDGILRGTISGGKVVSQGKEIKAVTFHNLEVVNSDVGYEVRIVFDV